MSSMSGDREQYKAVAEDILISIRAIEYVCDVHEDAGCRNNDMDKQEVYAIATNELKKQYPNMTDFKTFHECIDEVLGDANADSCPFCEKAYNE